MRIETEADRGESKEEGKRERERKEETGSQHNKGVREILLIHRSLPMFKESHNALASGVHVCVCSAWLGHSGSVYCTAQVSNPARHIISCGP